MSLYFLRPLSFLSPFPCFFLFILFFLHLSLSLSFCNSFKGMGLHPINPCVHPQYLSHSLIISFPSPFFLIFYPRFFLSSFFSPLPFLSPSSLPPLPPLSLSLRLSLSLPSLFLPLPTDFWCGNRRHAAPFPTGLLGTLKESLIKSNVYSYYGSHLSLFQKLTAVWQHFWRFGLELWPRTIWFWTIRTAWTIYNLIILKNILSKTCQICSTNIFEKHTKNVLLQEHIANILLVVKYTIEVLKWKWFIWHSLN